MTADTPLPDYQNPPVVEVVFAVAIRSLPLSVVDLVKFGLEHLSPDFTGQREQPSIRMPVESFGPAGELDLEPSLQLLSGPPPTRLWFQSNDNQRLVQLQRDWLACNWRDSSPGAEYPRYGSIEGFFLETWESFERFAEKNGAKGTPVVQQCELTYINHITPGPTWHGHGQVDKVLRLAGQAGPFLPEPEDAQLAFRYRIAHEGRDVGRLIVQAVPAWRRTDQSPLVQLSLTARGTPPTGGRNGLAAFFRLAHQWIVRGFEAVTTDQAQTQLWGKIP